VLLTATTWALAAASAAALMYAIASILGAGR
jgi:hypothetical protein